MILAPTLSLSAGSGAAIVRPTFSRDFAGERTLNNGTGPAITFTRGSIGTFFDANGTLQTASNDVPRFDHSGGTSLGLLIEESRQNLLLHSAGFDNAAWDKTGDPVTVTANQIASPDGTTSADLVAGTTDNDRHYALQIVSGATAGAAYTASIFVKAGTQRYIVFGDAGDTSWRLLTFDFNTLSISHSTGVTSSSAISVGNGWYRLSLTATRANSGNYQTFVGFSNAATNSSPPIYVESPSDTFYIWGAQLEAGAFPTSYIPTTSAAVTRSADSAVVTPISGFYNQSEGTLFAEVREGGSDLQYGAVSLDTNTSDNRIDLRRNANSGAVAMIVTTAGAGQTLESPTLTAAAQTYKFIGAYKTDDVVACVNGGTIAFDTSVTLPTLTHLRIGGLAATSPATGNAFEANGHIRKVAYYPKRLSNALLQSLTA